MIVHFVWATSLLVTLLDCIHAADDWSYEGTNGPDHWKDAEPPNQCGGSRQSPIDIDVKTSEFEAMPPLKFFGYNHHISTVSLENAHYTVKFSRFGGIERSIRGGPLTGRYVLDNFHVHWGNNGTTGSEHTINKKPFAAEVHLVHYKAEYGNLTNALLHPDGLCVLGITLQEAFNWNFMQVMLEHWMTTSAAEVSGSSGVSSTFAPFPLSSILPSEPQKFFFYKGSLTTPGCNEAVLWIVFDNPVRIDKHKLELFRQYRDDHNKPVKFNWRPTQLLNGRNVTRSFSL